MHTTNKMIGILVLTALAMVSAPSAWAATWTVTDGSSVVFTSKAPMESFDGKTDEITGSITIDTDDFSGPLTMQMVVDLASLDTGIGMRNTHMRENHLETEEFPEAVFTGHSIVQTSAPNLAPGQPVELMVRGLFNLHGVEREMDIPATVTLAADGSLTVDAAFEVKLSDHEIKRPKFLVMKLADEQQVKVSLKTRKSDS